MCARWTNDSEAVMLREASELAALGARKWDEPFVADDETVELGSMDEDDVRDVLAQSVWDAERRRTAQGRDHSRPRPTR